jgi:hypothetical protein
VALNETLQPEACIGDNLHTTYRLGHIQEVCLQALWNFMPKEYRGGPKLRQRNLIFRFPRVKVHGCFLTVQRARSPPPTLHDQEDRDPRQPEHYSDLQPQDDWVKHDADTHRPLTAELLTTV